VLIVKVKTITIDSHQVKVFSLDCKLWFSQPSDLTAYKRRVIHEKITCQRKLAGQFNEHVPTPIDFRG
jgi:hypothetical protein